MSKKSNLKIDAAKMEAASITPPTMNSVDASESASPDANVTEPQADALSRAEAPKPPKDKVSRASSSDVCSKGIPALLALIREELAKNAESNDRLRSVVKTFFGLVFDDGMEPIDLTDKPGRKALSDLIKALGRKVDQGFEARLAKEDREKLDHAVDIAPTAVKECRKSAYLNILLTGGLMIAVAWFVTRQNDNYQAFTQEVRQELPNSELVNHIRATDPDAFARYSRSLEEEKAQKAYNDSIQLANEIKAKMEKSRKRR